MLKVGAFFTIIMFALLFTAHWWISNSWKRYYSQSDMVQIAEIMNNAPVLPENFYQAYNKVNPGQRNLTLNQMKINMIIASLSLNDESGSKTSHCNCMIVGQFIDNKIPVSYHSWRTLLLAQGLEIYTTEEKCLDYIYTNIKVKEHARKYFDKPLENLTYIQCIELILRLNSPTFYQKHPQVLRIDVEKYLNENG